MVSQTILSSKKIPKKAHSYAAKRDVWSIPLPLMDKSVTKDELDLRRKSKYEVPIDRNDPNAGTISSVIYHIDGTEDLRTIIQWKKDITGIVNGKGITNPEVIVKLTMDRCEGAPRNTYEAYIEGQRAKRLLDSTELANNPPTQNEGEQARAFERRQAAHNRAIEDAKKITLDDHEKALQAIIEDASPSDVLAKQVRLMKHEMKKPYDLGFKRYISMLLKINLLELPELPPFAGKTQSLTKADLVEIITYGVPKKWQQQLKLQGFDTSKKTFKELVKFMEAQEEAEEETTPPAKKKNKGNDSRNEGGKWCAIHKTTSHNTDECRSNKKAHTSGNGNGNQKNGNNGNKTWVRKAEENKKFTQAEVNALVAKEIKKAKTNWAAQQKKRKGDDTGDLNVVDLVSNNKSVKNDNSDSPDLNELQLRINGIDLDDLDKMFDEETPEEPKEA